MTVLALAAVLGGSACWPSPGMPSCPAGGSAPASISLDDLGALGDALEARFPTCFGGIVRTGPSSADIYVVGAQTPVLVLARQLAGPTLSITLRPSDHALRDVRALKYRIDDEAGELHEAGIPTHATGIVIVPAGPRVLVGLDPDTPAARTALEQRYGATWLWIEAFGPVEPG